MPTVQTARGLGAERRGHELWLDGCLVVTPDQLRNGWLRGRSIAGWRLHERSCVDPERAVQQLVQRGLSPELLDELNVAAL